MQNMYFILKLMINAYDRFMSLKFPGDGPCDLINGLSLSDRGSVLVITEVFFPFNLS